MSEADKMIEVFIKRYKGKTVYRVLNDVVNHQCSLALAERIIYYYFRKQRRRRAK